MVAGLAGWTSPAPADPEPLVFSGIPIINPKVQLLVNEYGYSDSMLDRRQKFLDREYLSGEWAAAVYCEGGNLPPVTRWLTDWFVYPDFETPAPHFTSKYDPPFLNYGPNSHGFDVFGSTVMNADLEIAMTYETLDLGQDMSGRLALGMTPQGAGGTGSFLPSQRYVFRQSYTIKNISGLNLGNVRFHQFLHTLYGDSGRYDARDYGGGLPGYRHGVTLQGKSFGFNMQTDETVEHTDTLAMKFQLPPSGYELGAFGLKAAGDHQFGEPAAGVHKSVAANSLNGSDFFDPDENNPAADAWVAGALSFNLGSLAPNASTSLDVLLAVNTSYQVVHPPINLVIHKAGLANGSYTIDFEETTHNPLVGFILYKSPTLDQPKAQWPPAGVPYLKDIPLLNWRRFQAPANPATEPRLFFFIKPTIINDP